MPQKFAGFDMILRGILRSTAAHVAREALGTLVMSGVQYANNVRPQFVYDTFGVGNCMYLDVISIINGKRR